MDQLNLTSINFTNISSGHPSPSFSWGSRAAVAPAVVLCLCFLVGFPGNLAVIILKPNWQNLSRLSQSLMMNLALSDLLCLVTLPLWIYTLLFSWTLGTVACKIMAYFVYCSIYSSLLTVTALSVQRYMQVIQQQRCLGLKKRLLVLLWLTSMALSIPGLLYRQVSYSGCNQAYPSEVQQVAVMLTECFVGFGSFIITTCAYIFMKRKLNQAIFFNKASTSRLVSSIIVTFFILWMPYMFFNLVTVGGILSNNLRIVYFYDFGFYVFGANTFISSSINPLLYAFALRICRKNRNLNTNNGSC